MSTKVKEDVLSTPTSDVTAPPLPSLLSNEQAIATDRQALDDWVLDVRKRIREGDKDSKTHQKVDLHERLLAMQWELGKVAAEAVHFQGYKYHSIQSIENHVNRLSAVYRVHITPTRVNSIVLDGGVRLHLHFAAYCWETEQRVEWDWEDDGEDLTKAGSYTQKYGLMKFFHVGDGQDPDAEAERGKPRQRDNRSQARTPAPRNGTTAAPAATDEAKASLYELARSLPDGAGWGFKEDGTNIKIDAMLKSPAYSPDSIRDQLVAAHVKAHGVNCEHVKPASEKTATETLVGTETLPGESVGGKPA